jgi:hypothetical protein
VSVSIRSASQTGVLGVLVEQPGRERVAVGLVGDQIAAEQLATSRFDRGEREAELVVIHCDVRLQRTASSGADPTFDSPHRDRRS